MDPRRPQAVAWMLWLGVLIGMAALMYALRARLAQAHVALGFLLVVLGGSAARGRALGVTLAVLAFLAFNFLFLPPYHTFVVTGPLDWLVLGAFLITGVVAAQLLDRAQERAEVARERAVEVERLAALGAEALNAGRADEALGRIVAVIRDALGVACCEILAKGSAPVALRSLARAGSCAADRAGAPWEESAPWDLAVRAVSGRTVGAERPDGTIWFGAPGTRDDRWRWPPDDTPIQTLFVPLVVRDATLGALRIAHDDAFTLDPAREQFLSALSYYAALGVERVQLAAEAERAEAFRQADALKSALIAGVSHDLRTPLTTIKGLAHALRERGSSEAAAIEAEADRLNRLVADLLDLSRLNAGAMPMRVELNTVEDLVGAAVERASGVVGRGRIVVVPANGSLGDNGEAPVLIGRFDFVQALRALVNLIENAAKYSPAGAPIEVGVTRADEVLELRVADRGPGVEATEQERIFEPFYRAPGARADGGGAGLGLAIARRLAQEQGGDVRYEMRPGGGSVFTLVLPAAD